MESPRLRLFSPCVPDILFFAREMFETLTTFENFIKQKPWMLLDQWQNREMRKISFKKSIEKK